VSTRYALDRAFTVLVTTAALVGVIVLAVLLVDVIKDGSSMLSLEFLTSFPSQVFPENGGIYPALVGSLWLLGLTASISVPLGLGAAVYLEEYARDTRINRMIEINISNLAGVPSVIYGLLGLGIFVELLAPVTGGGSVLTGALTLSLLILPVIIVATREALRAIPDSIREGGYALGATQWEVIWSHLLPRAMPGALTGIILALSRAVGEAAPILVVGVSLYQTYVTAGPFDGYMALPTQIYDWISRPQEVFQNSAAAAIVVAMAVLLLANSFAIWLRNRYQQRS
jgi:phosphate transport system permease protein